MRRRNKSADPVWRVIVTPATREGAYHHDYGKYSTTVAIRIQCAGQNRMTYATLKITDSDFEDRVTTLKAEAEERASALQAVGAVVE